MTKKSFKDISLSCLGLGCMRLPSTNPNDPSAPIDFEKGMEIFDYAMKHGINYYDTAYVYGGGASERFLGEAIKGYDRDSFYLASKYNCFVKDVDYKGQFEEQLRRLQTDHIDFYLIHCLQDDNIDTYLSNGCIDYFMEQKEKGRITYLGFSAHASVETLEKFADHHQWDFAQLQINYYDWNYADTMKEYQILTDRNIPIMVMEPVRGGKLATLSEDAEAVLKAVHPEWSSASWALRFVRTLPNVQVILSGMSTLEQIVDNVATFEEEGALTEAEIEVLMKACDLYHKYLVVPCTACRYCTPECPMEIQIPDVLNIYNVYKTGGWEIREKLDALDSKGKPNDCIGCGACQGHCPQSIQIPEIMAELTEKFYK